MGDITLFKNPRCCQSKGPPILITDGIEMISRLIKNFFRLARVYVKTFIDVNCFDWVN